jgi:hypothetical protein
VQQQSFIKLVIHTILVNGVKRFFFLMGWDLSPLGTGATVWPIVPAPDDRWWWWLWSNRWNANWQGTPKYSEKTYPSATLSTTNPTWADPGSRGGKPTTNRLSYSTAKGYLGLSLWSWVILLRNSAIGRTYTQMISVKWDDIRFSPSCSVKRCALFLNKQTPWIHTGKWRHGSTHYPRH